MDAQRTIALIAFIIAGWVIASLALSGDVFQATVPINIGNFAGALAAGLGDIVLTAIVFLLSIVLYWIVRDRKLLAEVVRDIFTRRRGGRGTKPNRNFIRDVLGLMLFVGVLFAINASGLRRSPQPIKGGSNSNGTSLFPILTLDGQTFQSSLLAIYHFAVVWAVQIAFLAVAGVCAVIFVQAVSQLRKPESEPLQFDSAIAEETLNVLHKSAMELREADDYRKVVLECYRRLCEIFDARGGNPHRQLTARELQALMVREFGFAEKPISLLTTLFEEARYSAHVISTEMKGWAIAALNEIENSLRHSSEGTLQAIQ